MTKGRIAGTLATVLTLLALAIGERVFERDAASGAATTHSVATIVASATTPSVATRPPAAATHEGFLYGRVTMDDGTVYEGRLRWGGDEEALWSHDFNGRKAEHPWAARVPADLLPRTRGFLRDRPVDLSRPFMARMGDLHRIDARGRRFEVTLKSGTVFHLARFEADDLADGLRVWDPARGVVDLGEWPIRSIEFLPTPGLGAVPSALHGTVRTEQGDFTGLVQWDREQSLGSDELIGVSADGDVRLRFDAIRSITRGTDDGAEGASVTLRDGREIELPTTRAAGGLYVDDPRYGRVLVSWNAFRSVDFGAARTGPAYGDFPPGRPLSGTVVTRSGDRLAGRLVYDLDEIETTETLDAPRQGVDYMIPFGHVASIVLPDSDGRGGQLAGVLLQSGEELRLERAGDLGDGNGGMVILGDGGQPEYVPWSEVARIDFDRPPTVYLPR